MLSWSYNILIDEGICGIFNQAQDDSQGLMADNEPVWCAFCEDRPAIGRMVLMRDESREQVGELKSDVSAACDLHGRAWTGAPVGESDDCKVAVLQYVHPEFEKVTEKDIIAFAADGSCSMCGDPMGPIELWVAERILRAHPQAVLDKDYRWEPLCGNCADECDCDHCTGECRCDEEDASEEDD